MKKFILLTLVTWYFNSVVAQDFKFGDISRAEFSYNKNEIDSNANAVILKEYGETRIAIDDITNDIKVVFYYHVRIKIDNPDGYEHGNIHIPLYNEGKYAESIFKLTASSFNLVDGSFSETKFTGKPFSEVRDKYYKVEKFSMPDLRPGTIIEYSYYLHSPILFNFRQWQFQTNIPKLYSEYTAIVPPILNYNVSLRGPLKLTKSSSSVLSKCLVVYGMEQDCSKMVYIMENVPAFIGEAHMTAPKNFISAINFELAEIVRPGAVQKVTTNWTDVDGLFVNDRTFGGQLKRKGLFKDKIPNIIASKNTDLEKAIAVYDFIKKEIKWDGYLGYGSQDNIKKAHEAHLGNIGDINISLILALNDAGLNAEAVVLSTRDRGTVNKVYPVISDFNYVIAKLNIGQETYLLDASDPQLAFGMLPLRALNGEGRVISLGKRSSWIELKPTPVNNTSIELVATMHEDGMIRGNLNVTTLGYSAYERRKIMGSYSSIEEFVEAWDETMNNIKVVSHKITHLAQTNDMLTEEYEIEISFSPDSDLEKLQLNPFIFNKFTKNPYNLSNRTYPIDLGWPYSEQQIIKISLPYNYEVLVRPQSTSINIPENASQYFLKTGIENNILSLEQSFKMNRSVYDINFYPALKELHNKIIQIHKSDFVIKKIQ